ncbi:hypothetical protein GLOTRDRAFT_96269 [Gloeophyllum trabeum ATCC 11539]|uniref:Uncharacterized protein n=1 Tax=Gloeophyllum trabeum (strain ATCC 11539 / FP-39264 / Madison 617) TaxID=670483 RepID=S7PV76_GLOTA|nr:uncharacterized protein GLOTRDRAFT_96269 [Gloeophyllum trabeum ATCC 11539]EPQ51516.1 hypothetical protein GLOTRDRAFT_96269 [Gloeophyllum trabeum ATCC 11539]
MILREGGGAVRGREGLEAGRNASLDKILWLFELHRRRDTVQMTWEGLDVKREGRIRPFALRGLLAGVAGATPCRCETGHWRGDPRITKLGAKEGQGKGRRASVTRGRLDEAHELEAADSKCHRVLITHRREMARAGGDGWMDRDTRAGSCAIIRVGTNVANASGVSTGLASAKANEARRRQRHDRCHWLRMTHADRH